MVTEACNLLYTNLENIIRALGKRERDTQTPFNPFPFFPPPAQKTIRKKSRHGCIMQAGKLPSIRYDFKI